MKRRRFLGILTIGGSAALLAACQAPAAAPTAAPTAKPAAAAPTTAPAASKPAAAAPPAPTAEAKAAGWEQQWASWVEGAKQEGNLVISGPPNQAVRAEVPKAFKNRHGVDVEYLGGRSGDLMTRLKSERAAGQYTVDGMIAGASTLYTQAYPDKMLEPLPPVLINPEASDPKNWTRGKLWLADPEEKYILRLSNYSTLLIGVNRELQNPDEIKSWKDLLQPKFKGKISAYDPTVSGPGSATGAYLLEALGEGFFKALYVDQDPGISREERQLADWLARGNYPITIGLGSSDLEPLRNDGFPISVVRDLPDAPGTTSAGFGMLAMLNNAPHPNATRVFMNWMAGKEGSEIYHRAYFTVSARSDLDNSWAPSYIIPTPGVNYFDIYSWEFTERMRNPEGLERMKRLAAR